MDAVHNKSIVVISVMLKLIWQKLKNSCFYVATKKKDKKCDVVQKTNLKYLCDVSKVKHLITPQGIEKQICGVVLRGSQNI